MFATWPSEVGHIYPLESASKQRMKIVELLRKRRRMPVGFVGFDGGCVCWECGRYVGSTKGQK